MTDPEDLQPLDPRDAVQMYKRDRERELSDATLQSHGYRLERFLEWCDIEDIDNLNIEHYHPREEYVEVRHNPDTDTPLKNAENGERDVALSSRMCRLLDDYIDEHRWDRREEFDRRPLFTTKQERATKNTIRNWTYRITRPCTFGRECPHDRDPEDCDGMDNMRASKCPSSTAPHSIRHGAITDYLNRDIDRFELFALGLVQSLAA